MSKSSAFTPTPIGSRGGSPVTSVFGMDKEDERDRQALLMENMGADRAKAAATALRESTQISTRDQGEWGMPFHAKRAVSWKTAVIELVERWVGG